MSGHNKWSTIKHKKGKTDAKRGKVFSRLAKELIQATRDGGKDMSANARLRTAIASAKAVNMPNDNIDRAIKKGSGELGGVALEEMCYEAYGAGGVAIMVDCLSDNRNRTAADVRHIFTKANSSLASSNAVAWMFHRKARFVIEGEKADEEALMEMCFEADLEVEDISVDEDIAEIIAPPEAFNDIVVALEAAAIVPTESGVVRLPENQVQVSDVSTAKQVIRLLDTLEDYDDVQGVVSNADFDDSVLEELAKDE